MKEVCTKTQDFVNWYFVNQETTPIFSPLISLVLWYPFDFSFGKWHTIKSDSFTIMNISKSFFQAEGVGAISEREGQCDPIRCDPWGNPLHRLSAQPAGEEKEWGRRERGGKWGKEITQKPEENTPSLVSSLISLSFISLLCDISQIYLTFKLCESYFFRWNIFPLITVVTFVTNTGSGDNARSVRLDHFVR